MIGYRCKWYLRLACIKGNAQFHMHGNPSSTACMTMFFSDVSCIAETKWPGRQTMEAFCHLTLIYLDLKF